MATNEQIQKALKSIGCNPYMNPESYRTIREVLQDALNPWKEVMCLDLDQEVHNGEYWLLMSKSGEVRKLKFVSNYGYDNEYIPYWISPTDDELEYDDYTFTHYAKPLPNPPEKIK